MILLPIKGYKPGEVAPPHLSPFGDGDGYMPEREREIKILKGEEVAEDEEIEQKIEIKE